MRVEKMLQKAVEMGASDVRIYSYSFPYFRVKKKLIKIGEEIIFPEDIYLFLKNKGIEVGKGTLDKDCAFEEAGHRWRASVFRGKKGIGMVLRKLPIEIPELESLNLPELFISLIFDEDGNLRRKSGLILITGETNSGKSTTLASVIKKAVVHNSLAVITLEDPIEYPLEELSTETDSSIFQREVGKDTESFARGLKSALREDPDLILVGEIRDAETMRTALNASMTGHLVLSTLHTNDTISTIDRIRNLFPPEEHNAVLDALSRSLFLIQSQMLYRNSEEKLIPVVEVLHCNEVAQQLIREGKIQRIRGEVLFGGNDQLPRDVHLISLYNRGLLSKEEVLFLAANKEFVLDRITGVESDW